MTVDIAAPTAYEEPITVQIGYIEDGEFILEECNHAGAIEEELDYGGLRHDHVGDLDWFDDMRPTLVCDKPNCDFQELIEPEEPDWEED